MSLIVSFGCRGVSNLDSADGQVDKLRNIRHPVELDGPCTRLSPAELSTSHQE